MMIASHLLCFLLGGILATITMIIMQSKSEDDDMYENDGK